MNTTATTTKTVEQTMTEMFNAFAFHTDTPAAFTAKIMEADAAFAERPAVQSEWRRFVQTKFAEHHREAAAATRAQVAS